MTCDVIATGSSGNAVLLEGQVLLDCGVPYKQIQPYAKTLNLVLLTHIHGDHFAPSTIRRLGATRPSLRFGCCEWLVGSLLRLGIPAHNVDVYQFGSSYNYGTLTVEAVPLVHDVPNCGYKISANGERAIYATDTGTMEHITATDYDLYLIEANYTERDLEERIKRKTEQGKFLYEYRVAAGHLSKGKADTWLADNATPNKSKVVYLHGHKDVHHEIQALDGSAT